MKKFEEFIGESSIDSRLTTEAFLKRKKEQFDFSEQVYYFANKAINYLHEISDGLEITDIAFAQQGNAYFVYTKGGNKEKIKEFLTTDEKAKKWFDIIDNYVSDESISKLGYQNTLRLLI
jgi:hypothetical protein